MIRSYSRLQIKTETQARRLKLEAEVAERAAKKVKEAPKKQRKADKTPGPSSSLSSQFQNPIVLANAVTVAAVSAVLGFTGFKKHQAGQLSWKVIGLGSAFVAAFGTADYFLSRFVGGSIRPHNLSLSELIDAGIVISSRNILRENRDRAEV